MAKAKKEEWSEGTYVLTASNFEKTIFDDNGEIEDAIPYVTGDEVELDARTARRLGAAGAIAKQDSVQAKMAKGELNPEALDLTKDEDQLEEQMQAIKARLDELKGHKEEREELRESQGPHPNVLSMKLPDRDEAHAAVAEEQGGDAQIETRSHAKNKSKGESKSQANNK